MPLRDAPEQTAGFVQGCGKLRAESSTFVDRGFVARGDRMSLRLVDETSDRKGIQELGLMRAARRPKAAARFDRHGASAVVHLRARAWRESLLLTG